MQLIWNVNMFMQFPSSLYVWGGHLKACIVSPEGPAGLKKGSVPPTPASHPSNHMAPPLPSHPMAPSLPPRPPEAMW
jgi:hypothetical protein